jgi:ferredoxin
MSTLLAILNEPQATKQCRRCGADFVTASRVRKRCDTCRVIVAADLRQKENARQRRERAANRKALA